MYFQAIGFANNLYKHDKIYFTSEQLECQETSDAIDWNERDVGEETEKQLWISGRYRRLHVKDCKNKKSFEFC